MNVFEKITKHDSMAIESKFEIEIYAISEKIWALEAEAEEKRKEKAEVMSKEIIKGAKITSLEEYLTILEENGGMLAFSEIEYEYDGVDRFNFRSNLEIKKETEILFEIFSSNEDKMLESLDYEFFEIVNESPVDGWVRIKERWTGKGLALNKVFTDYMAFEELEKKLITDTKFKEEVKSIATLYNFRFIKKYLNEIDMSGQYQKSVMLQAVLEPSIRGGAECA